MARSGSGVKQVTASSVEIEFTYQGKRCRERIKCNPTAANLRRLEVFRDEILASIAAGTFDYAVTFPNSKRASEFEDKGELTVGEWLDRWLDGKEQHLKNSTYYGYFKAARIFKSSILASIPLTRLKKKDVKAWCESYKTSNKTLANYLSVLRDALQIAVDDEIIEFNPLRDFRFVRNEPPKDERVDPFTPDEQQAILNATQGQYRNLFQFAFWTGLRTSELIALEWGDVDFVKGCVLIQRARTKNSKKPETTKTRSGRREVKLLPPAMEALIDQKQHTFLAGKVIFNNDRTGQQWQDDSQIRTYWVSLLKRAGVRYRNPYQTRHTFASMMLSAGESLPWISRQLGHSSVLMTTKAYARYIPDTMPEAGNKAVEMFAEKRTLKRT